MGQLAGFSYRDITARLAALGFSFARQAKGGHEIWRNADTRRRTVIPNHRGDIPEGTVRGIVDLAGVTVEQFLAD